MVFIGAQSVGVEATRVEAMRGYDFKNIEATRSEAIRGYDFKKIEAILLDRSRGATGAAMW